ncbi:unnamed protein product [Didymodactylos carnosus]|uniref:NAD(P)(+)--arginine ADP-ribosyltransferase n=1 Tax=Didymodactylos carnosus TaxID=1234261 RepID=A0A8S2DIH5_9BILA|nr:unnamed protein product [Didymodactylos carnosus]CAF3712445.1 unnamed protein product [Didymodactylos carnosus]
MPITGVRYKCLQCPDYDLCQACYIEKKMHNEHCMAVIRHPCQDFDQIVIDYYSNYCCVSSASNMIDSQSEVDDPLYEYVNQMASKYNIEIAVVSSDERIHMNRYFNIISDVHILGGTLLSSEVYYQEKSTKVFVVLIGDDADWELLEAMTLITSVFVLGQKSSENDVKCDKIVNYYTTEVDLLLGMITEMERIDQHLVTFNLYNSKQIGIRNLTKRSAEFLWLQLFKHVLSLMPDNSDEQTKQRMLNKCREYYYDSEADLKEIKRFEETYQSADVIQWYTAESFIYRMINKALRTENIMDLYLFRFFIFDLSSKLKEKHCLETTTSLLVYRGLKQTQSEIDDLQLNIGNLISPNGFMSSSRSKTVANTFATKPSKFNKNLKPILYEIEILTSDCIHLDIAEYSEFPYEQEVLFDLGVIFRIENVFYDDNDKIWLVRLKTVNKGPELIDDYLEYSRTEMAETNILFVFGQLLIVIGKYDESQLYSENLLAHSTTDRAQCYFHLARAQYFQLNFESAFKNYHQSMLLEYQEPPLQMNRIAKILNNIGVLYHSEYNEDLALSYYLLALRLRGQHYATPVQYAQSFNNIGTYYQKTGDYDCALDYHQYALKLRETFLPRNHPDLADSCDNLAKIYSCENDYNLSIYYYQRSYEIRSATLPAEHPDILESLKNLSWAHTSASYRNNDNVNHRQLALSYRLKGIDILKEYQPKNYPKIMNESSDILQDDDINELSAPDFVEQRDKLEVYMEENRNKVPKVRVNAFELITRDIDKRLKV